MGMLERAAYRMVAPLITSLTAEVRLFPEDFLFFLDFLPFFELFLDLDLRFIRRPSVSLTRRRRERLKVFETEVKSLLRTDVDDDGVACSESGLTTE